MRSVATILTAVQCVFIVVFGLTGCDRQPATAAPATPPEQVYMVRGRITGLPIAGQPGSELAIAHEAIPSFVRNDGKLGMNAMVMPFTPAPGVSLEGLAVGDPVEFTFEVRWKSKPRMQLTKISKLPADTELVLPKSGH
jgi:hypothetical protein